MKRILLAALLLFSILLTGCTEEQANQEAQETVKTEALQKEVHKLKMENGKLKTENQKLKKQVELLQRKQFEAAKESKE